MKVKKTQRLKFVVAIIACMAVLITGLGVSALQASAALSDNGPDNKYFEIRTVNEATEDAAALNLEVTNEGFVLMKNKNKALPLGDDEMKITVLGEDADNLSYGGSGSGSLQAPGLVGDNSQFAAATFYDAMAAGGFTVNPTVQRGYSDGTFNTDSFSYFTDSFATYNTAFIVLMRTGSEFVDNAAHHVAGHSNPDDHYQMLTDDEIKLISLAKGKFDKIVVLLNTPAVVEIGDLEDDDDIDAILWMGLPGYNGILSLGPVLKGEVNPSGRTVDFWMTDAKKDPTWFNFGDNAQAHYALGTGAIDPATGLAETKATYNTSASMGWKTANKDTTKPEINPTSNTAAYLALDYAEGIYMGYRYYETVCDDMNAATAGTGNDWYDEATVYPFGYGLSYTTFDQEIVSITGDTALNVGAGELEITVKVSNTGNVAGKDVVQIYNTPPYDKTAPHGKKIDKASVNLVGFGKSEIIEPGASKNVVVKIATKDLASFDYNDANENNYSGYEVETGAYTLSARNNSHEIFDEYVLTRTAAGSLMWDEDGNPATPNNIFSQPVKDHATNGWSQYNTLAHEWLAGGEAASGGYLTRDQLLTRDLKSLAWMETAANDFKRETYNGLSVQFSDYSYEDWDNSLTAEVETGYQLNPWLKKAADVAGWEQRATAYDAYKAPIQLSDMVGVPLEGSTPLGSDFPSNISSMTASGAWLAFMNQLTWAEMATNLFTSGSYRNAAIPSIGKEITNDQDGPGQLKEANNSNAVVNAYNGNGYAFACEVVQASTWNVELLYEIGVNTGNLSILIGVNGWYGPAMNTHRNILAGRNFEYYSQDGIQGGLIAAACIKGAQSRGVHVYVKHCFLNDQETNRNNTPTFATEQAIREIYARQFELSITDGNANGTMTAFNRIGIQPALSYAVNIQMFEEEWGFEALSVTDMYSSGTTGWTGNAMARGHTFPLGSVGSTAGNTLDGTYDTATKKLMVGSYVDGKYSATTLQESPTQWYAVRSTVQMWLYVTVNLNANMNGYRDGYLNAHTITANQGAAISQSVFGEYKSRVIDALGEHGYTVTATDLPSGLKVASNGDITGVAAVEGASTFTVSMRGVGNQHFIADTAKITINTTNKMSFSSATAAIGTAYSGSIVQPFYTSSEFTAPPSDYNNAANVGKIFGQFSATGLPAGLTVNAATGALTGTPTVPGKYTPKVVFKVTTAVVQSVSMGTTYYQSGTIAEYSSTLEFTVGGGFNVIFDDGTKTDSQVVTTGNKITVPATPEREGYRFLGWSATEGGAVITLPTGAVTADATYYAVWEEIPEYEMGDDGYWYHYGEKTENKWEGVDGQNGQNGEKGADGQDATGGCGSVISLNAAIVSIVLIGGAAILIIVKMRRNKNTD